MTKSTIPAQDIHNVLSNVLPRIKSHVEAQTSASKKRPFLLGLTGLQGSGKSTWTDALVQALNDEYKYNTINISLDDLYLDHDDLIQVRDNNPSNRLLRTRGQPGTHDIALAVDFFDSLTKSSEKIIPSFDKSLFNGEGGRAPQDTWRRIPADVIIDIVIFEGWCVGFQPLPEDEISRRWNHAKEVSAGGSLKQTLGEHELEHLLQVNKNLRQYCELFMGPQNFDFLVHLDTDDLINVYGWRLEQEHALRDKKKGAMSDEEVIRFVKGYMPAYELYLDQLRRGFFSGREGKGQLSVVLDERRKVMEIRLV
ncbi:D-glycerate 3-kinase-like protein [Aspergillus piperis CBS 112811]|uniref:D-glycerate 3-kinase-like protein n=1 Tax=Aspergillus piperis CBS 112811 TaxID=1448313 RepID=A0A8G1R2X3_9EURO|nr:D-glycerate 3-kinase-like protein [Aspergillus piperis CBS 112811]RAH59051.1 D-glycerate 3-kinase-like protein [Aspergillus piperis CBS 112811]